jgi:hypothetical protein
MRYDINDGHFEIFPYFWPFKLYMQMLTKLKKSSGPSIHDYVVKI